MKEKLKNINMNTIKLVVGLVFIIILVIYVRINEKEVENVPVVKKEVIKTIKVNDIVYNYNFNYEFIENNNKMNFVGYKDAGNEKFIVTSDNVYNYLKKNNDYYIKKDSYEIINESNELNIYHFYKEFYNLQNILKIVKEAPVMISHENYIIFSVDLSKYGNMLLNIENYDGGSKLIPLKVSFNDENITYVEWDFNNHNLKDTYNIQYNVLKFSYYNYNLISELDFTM